MTLDTSVRPDAPSLPDALYGLTLRVASSGSPADIYEASLDALADSLGVERASILLLDADGVMRFKAWRGLSASYRQAVEGHSPWSPIDRDVAPVLVPDVETDPSLHGLRDVISREGIRSLAFVPLTIGDRLLGKFMLYYQEPHAFTPAEVTTAKAIAAHVAFAIDQQERREIERRHKQLLETLGVAVYTTDARGRITFFNEEAAALWGRRPELGELWCGSLRLFWPDGRPMEHAECPMAVAVREQRPVRGRDAILERPDGSRIHFIPYPTPMFDAEGHLTGAVNVLVDVSEAKAAEAVIARHEARLLEVVTEKDQVLAKQDETIRLYEEIQHQLASLIEASSALLLTRPREAGVTAILKIATKLLRADAYAIWQFVADGEQWEIVLSAGLSDEYVQASAIRDHDGTRELAAAMVVEDVLAEERLQPYTERYEREGITSIFVLPLRIGPEEHGTLAFYYRQRHEFSDLEVRLGSALSNLASASLIEAGLFEENAQARQALEEANRDLEQTAEGLRVASAAKDEFLSLVSHELKTPLTMIRGNASILYNRKENLEAHSRDAALLDIVTESERLNRIIENLLLLARSETGQLVKSEPLIVIRVVRRVVERFRQHYPERRFEIIEHGDPRPVVFPEGFLEQVIENLIANAEKYSPKHEPIVIDSTRTPEEFQMRVLDRGVGLREDEAERLFQPFYRGGTSRRAEGLGIGLAVCRRLVEAQGGRMWAKNRPGGGAEFGFAVPIAVDARVPGGASPSSAAGGR